MFIWIEVVEDEFCNCKVEVFVVVLWIGFLLKDLIVLDFSWMESV